MSTIENLTNQFNQLQSANVGSGLNTFRENAFDAFNQTGIPDMKHEEWKYTRINKLFKEDYQLLSIPATATINFDDIDGLRLPGHEHANELIFVNGHFSFELSSIRSPGLLVLPLEAASNSEFKGLIAEHLGHSSK